MELFEQIKQAKIEIEGYTLGHSSAVREMYYEKFLGPKGLVKNLFGQMKHLPSEERKNAGQSLNEFRQFVEEKYEPYKKIVIEKKEEKPKIIIPAPKETIQKVHTKAESIKEDPSRRDPAYSPGDSIWSMINSKAANGEISSITTEQTRSSFTISYGCYFSRKELGIEVDGMPDRMRIERKEDKLFPTKEKLLETL